MADFSTRRLFNSESIMSETHELLTDYIRKGSEIAFRELVTRYFDLVYSAAVRLVDGDTHRAKDVAQIVFADLARMANGLNGNSMLGGWLHRHTCFVARNLMRGERRRQVREKFAVEMNELNDKGDSVLAQVAPILDEAINELGPDDRDVILLRFFEGRNLRSVGEILGITENVAQKRVARALEELGFLLQRHGVTFSTTALAGSLVVGAVLAAPAGLALSVAGGALAGASGAVAVTSAKVAVMTNVKIAIVGALVILGVATAILLRNQSAGIVGNRNGPVGRLQSSRAQAEENLQGSSSNTQESGAFVSANQVDLVEKSHGEVIQPPRIQTDALKPPKDQGAILNQVPAPSGAIGSIVRLYSKSGSKLTIKGTSTIHDWQAESRIIGGFLEVGPGFALEPGLVAKPGPVQARGEANIRVHSLLSVDKDGRHYSDTMDLVMWESLRSDKHPKILYHLVNMSFRKTTNYNDVVEYEFLSRGELVIAGITNAITMPVFVRPSGGRNLRISGHLPIKMRTFHIEPPATGVLKARGDVEVVFNWIVGPRADSDQPSQLARIASDSFSESDEMIPAQSIRFINTHLSQVLSFYAEFSQADQLDIDEKVKSLPLLIHFTNTEPRTRTEVIGLLDNALLEQGGIVVRHPEINHVTMRLRR